jgi:hypothetical protein
LPEVEGVIGVVVEVDSLILLLHAGETVLDPLLTELYILLFSGIIKSHKLFVGHVCFGIR